jgi:myo-inositol-1(or 4)-monophosphatase
LHTNRLGHQPTVVDADREIRVGTASPVRVTVDGGRPRKHVAGGAVLTVTGDPDPAYVVETPQDRPFFDALGERLGWGGHNVASVPDPPTSTQPESTETDRSVAVDAVRAAGDAVRRAQPESRDSRDSRDEAAFLDAVTNRSERVIRAHLSQAGPDHGLRVNGSVVRAGDGHTWQATPLDGAADRARNAPQYAVGLALVESGDKQRAGSTPVVSAVGAPARGELVVTDREGTVLVDGAPPESGEETPVGPTERSALDGCRFVTDGRPDLVELDGFSDTGTAICRPGCGTLALTQVATGRADACWLAAATPAVWPAIWLVRGAGGQVTTPDGERLSFEGGEPQALVASNGHVHESFRTQIEQSL